MRKYTAVLLHTHIHESPSTHTRTHTSTHLSIFRIVHGNRGVALRGVVDVPVVSYGSDGLHGVSSHTGHGDR